MRPAGLAEASTAPPESPQAVQPAHSGVRAQPADSAATTRQQYARNVIALLFAYVLPRACVAASVVVAARVLGAERFGVYGSAAAFAVILSLLATLGMQPLLIREMARSPERALALVHAADVLKLGFVAVMLIALLALARLFDGEPGFTAAALILGFAYAVGAFVENRAARVQAEERMHVWTEASAALGVVTGGLGIVLVLATGSVLWFCASAVAGQLAALAWLQRRSGRAPSQAIEPVLVRSLLRGVLPFAAAFIMLTLHAKIAVLLVAHWRPPADTGVFVAGYKFIDLTQALTLVGITAAYPRLARTFDPRSRAPRAPAVHASLLAMLVAMPAAAVLWLAKEPVVTLLFGGEYAATVPVVGLLALSVPALATNVCGSWLLAAAGRMRHAALLYGCAVVLDVVLCAMWVPERGPMGAAAALLVTEWSLAAAMLYVLRAVGSAGSTTGAGSAVAVATEMGSHHSARGGRA